MNEMTIFTAIYHCPRHGSYAVSVHYGDVLRCAYCVAEAKQDEFQRAEDRMEAQERAELQVKRPQPREETR